MIKKINEIIKEYSYTLKEYESNGCYHYSTILNSKIGELDLVKSAWIFYNFDDIEFFIDDRIKHCKHWLKFFRSKGKSFSVCQWESRIKVLDLLKCIINDKEI
ncbi:MAG: hypothetical protein ACRC0A_01700 [Chitinophagaceae bacterium]